MLVAFCGKMRSGKSWLANMLARYHGYQVVPFAGALRRDLMSLGISEELLRTKPPHIRKLMQVYGAARRAEDHNHWVKRAFFTIDTAYDPCVIDDLRYPNEIYAVRAYGGIVIRVKRPDMEPTDHDESETSLDHMDDSEFDGVISASDGDLKSLYEQLLDILEKHEAL